MSPPLPSGREEKPHLPSLLGDGGGSGKGKRKVVRGAARLLGHSAKVTLVLTPQVGGSLQKLPCGSWRGASGGVPGRRPALAVLWVRSPWVCASSPVSVQELPQPIN